MEKSVPEELQEEGRRSSVVMMAPVHLSSMDDICRIFGRKRSTVKRWYDEGAPIACEGPRYCAEYGQLMGWLVERSSRVKQFGKSVR